MLSSTGGCSCLGEWTNAVGHERINAAFKTELGCRRSQENEGYRLGGIYAAVHGHIGRIDAVVMGVGWNRCYCRPGEDGCCYRPEDT